MHRHGLRVMIVDKHPRTGAHSYALALHPLSAQLLQRVGAADGLLEDAHRVEQIRFYEGPEERLSLSLAALDVPCPYATIVPQRVLEAALEEQLRRVRIPVGWNHRVQAIELGSGPLTVKLARLDAVTSGYPIARMEWEVVKTIEIRAAAIIGADGYHSFTRESAGIEYRQIAPEQHFSVYEFMGELDADRDVRVVLEPGSTSVLWPMGDQRWRWTFQIDSPADHDPGLDQLNALIRERAPWWPQAPGPIHWASQVQFDTRLAERFGSGRVRLVGDAAHQTSPVGVHSMNAGLQEAWTLGALVAERLRTGETEALEAAQRIQLNTWERLLGLDGELRFDANAGPWVRSEARRIIASIPATGSDLQALVGQAGLTLTLPADSTKPEAGSG
jgi:2-polyprenyl-6-methoxyphenol hydroxylase-like FAD-dependent oxidoreductase